MTKSTAGAGLLLLAFLGACGGSEPVREPVREPGAQTAAGPNLAVDTTVPLVPDEPGSADAVRGTTGEAPVAAGTRPPGPDAGAELQGAGAPAAAIPPEGAHADSAALILTRAAERYRATASLQADFTMRLENTLLRSTIESAGVLYQERPDRLLLRFTEPAGDVILSDGEHFWIYYPSVDAAQVIRSPAAAGGRSGVDLQAQFLGDPTTRFRYTLEGTEAVAGRAAWRLQLVPRERAGYRSLRVWLDQRDYLARRFEIHEDNGTVRRFELRNVRVDRPIADELFRFQVPAGARVIAQ